MRARLLDAATFTAAAALAAAIIAGGAAAWAWRKGLLPAIDLGDLDRAGGRR